MTYDVKCSECGHHIAYHASNGCGPNCPCGQTESDILRAALAAANAEVERLRRSIAKAEGDYWEMEVALRKSLGETRTLHTDIAAERQRIAVSVERDGCRNRDTYGQRPVLCNCYVCKTLVPMIASGGFAKDEGGGD